MPPRPNFSLIVPTRSRSFELRRFADSLIATARDLDQIELILVVDSDDPESSAFKDERLTIRRVIVPPGQTMGQLNGMGYAAATGTYIMLLNDDVIIRTRGWDRIALACLQKFPDAIALVHVNDTLMKDYLCTFPLVSRLFCEKMGGICPPEYIRYRIDDHIEDIFNILAALGERRAVYLPDVIFEHTNSIEHPQAGRVYESKPEILAHDAPLFDALFAERKKLAWDLLQFIRPSAPAEQRRMLDQLTDPFALRIAGRQQLVRTLPLRRTRAWIGRPIQWKRRFWNCLMKKGLRGVVQALCKKVYRREAATVANGVAVNS